MPTIPDPKKSTPKLTAADEEKELIVLFQNYIQSSVEYAKQAEIFNIALKNRNDDAAAYSEAFERLVQRMKAGE